jgi:hydrogenase maturation protease
LRRVICIGNRWVGADDAGPRVYDRLCGASLPSGVEVIDGGLGGLALAPLAEGAERVVFVDAVSGFGAPGAVVVLRGPALEGVGEERFGHGGGLGWLLRSLPRVGDGAAPEVVVVGLEGPADEGGVARAAEAALRAVGAEQAG